MQARPTSARWFFFQCALSSCTQGLVSRPFRIRLSSAGVSLKLIFNTLFPSASVRILRRLVLTYTDVMTDDDTEQDRNHDALDRHLISFSGHHRCSSISVWVGSSSAISPSTYPGSSCSFRGLSWGQLSWSRFQSRRVASFPGHTCQEREFRH